MALCTVPRIQAAAGKIALSPGSINLLVGDEASVLPSWPDFDLTVELTGVTNCYATAFSLQWNPTYFNCTGAAKGDFLEPGGTGGTFWMGPGIDNVAGELHEAVYTQLATTAPVTLPDGTWGLIATVSFKYVGPTPTIGYPIATQINATNLDSGTLMRSYWADGGQNDFAEMVPCQFHYQVVETLVHNVEGFDVKTVSNTIVSAPVLNTTQKELRFNVTGQESVTGFCNVTIPKGLMDSILGVTLDGFPPDSVTITENATHTFVDFTYTLASTLQVAIEAGWVIPEFPTLTFIIILMIATIAATILGKTVSSIKRRERVI